MESCENSCAVAFMGESVGGALTLPMAPGHQAVRATSGVPWGAIRCSFAGEGSIYAASIDGAKSEVVLQDTTAIRSLPVGILCLTVELRPLTSTALSGMVSVTMNSIMAGSLPRDWVTLDVSRFPLERWSSVSSSSIHLVAHAVEI